MSEISEYIKQRKKDLKYSISVLSHESNIETKRLYTIMYHNGKMNLNEIERLSIALQVDPVEFLQACDTLPIEMKNYLLSDQNILEEIYKKSLDNQKNV